MYELSITEKHYFIQACNFINLPREYDFSKFYFKRDKADAHILKKYFQEGITKPYTCLHSVPPSSVHLHPAHFSLHLALHTTLNIIRIEISHATGKFPKI